MGYSRLPFEQYFIDASRGQWGCKTTVDFTYDIVKYKHGDHVHNAYYKVLYNEERNVIQIYFKETTDETGWRANFEFSEKYFDSFEYKGKKVQLRVHRGWAAMYVAMKHMVRDHLCALMDMHPKADVEIIGWSLGSAIAQLCAQDLYFNFNIKSHVFTYGSVKPWSGLKKITKEYLSQCYVEAYNFKDHNDIVGYMVPFPSYFSFNPIKIKQDKFCLAKLFKPFKYHTEYWKADYYKDLNF